MRKITNYQLLITNYKRGFTLIELLIVIAIIGIVSSLLLSNFIGVRQRARDTQRKSDLKQIQSALEIYRADYGTYPTNPDIPFNTITYEITCIPGTSIAVTSGSPPTTTTYMQQIPCDPSKTGVYKYYYIYSSGSDTYSLVACLENSNDPSKDSSLDSRCGGASPAPASITIKNP